MDSIFDEFSQCLPKNIIERTSFAEHEHDWIITQGLVNNGVAMKSLNWIIIHRENDLCPISAHDGGIYHVQFKDRFGAVYQHVFQQGIIFDSGILKKVYLDFHTRTKQVFERFNFTGRRSADHHREQFDLVGLSYEEHEDDQGKKYNLFPMV